MKLSALILFAIFILAGALALAHGNEAADADNHTAREEAEGKALWEKLQAKELTCANFDEDDFAALGEYFMGQMLGASHESMNNMMARMMGQAGEKEAHAVMGKRFSGCDSSAAYPAGAMGVMPMMNMMGGWSSPFGGNQFTIPMMWNFGSGPFGWFGLGLGWVFMLFWWLLVIAGIVFLVRWLVNQTRGASGGKSALEILKERYAKGEVAKHEYEEMKKEILS